MEVPEYGGEDRTFWQPESLVAVTFISAHPDWAIRSRPSWLRIGDVYRISAPMTRESVEWRRRQAREMA
ncbi:hypothetical protein GCM10009799_33390 [Nocardiopsis rhodophaea]|uniref:Uncharacterized protein n=1 Tax=Nocardiopsis rhodophaea TaxID=280238 RepID=A0ABP5ENR4_9ACTN